MIPPARLAGARRRAALVLRVEALVPALAPSAAVAGLWMAAALFGLPTLLPPLLAAPVTAAALVAAVVLAVRRVRRLAPHPTAALDRRLELASRLPHRPLAALADRRAAGAAALWDVHQARLAGSITRLRAGWPRPVLAPADRWGLRFVVPVAVLAGLLVAREDAGALLLAAAAPGIAPVPGPAGNLQAWISPPAFTGLAPVFLHAGTGETARVPEGSVLTASLTGSAAAPHLAGGRHGAAPSFTSLGDGSFQLAERLDRSGPIRIRQGGHLVANWQVEVTPLGAPVASWAADPGPYRGGWRTALPWRAADPYGVASMRAELRPVGVAGAPAIDVAIPLDGDPHDASGTEIPDLSASPFAGTTVAATLIARDRSGIEGRSDARRFTLPQRPFRNPLARAVIDIRRRLALRPDDHEAAAADLATLGRVPRVFDRAGSAGTYLNLEAVAALLRTRPERTANAEAEDRLWELALLLEDASHEGAQAARSALAMRSAREALDQQVQHMRELGARGQTPAAQAELGRRIEALKRAIRQRLHDLMAQALKQGTVLPPEAGGQGTDALSRMMRHLDDAARAGRPEDAARALSSMEDMLDRMRPATPGEVRQALARMQAGQQAAKQMQALGDMVKREGQLLDGGREARRQSSRPAAAAGDGRAPARASPPHPPTPTRPTAASNTRSAAPPRRSPTSSRRSPARSPKRSAARGPRCRRPKPPSDAATTRRRPAPNARRCTTSNRAASRWPARCASARRAPRAAPPLWCRASRRAATAACRATRTTSPAGIRTTPGRTSPRDPLGRKLTGNGRATGDDTELALPDDSARARNREIEEELRQRDSDRERPPEELRYLDRLLQAF